MTPPLTIKHKLLLLFSDSGIVFDERYDFNDTLAAPLSSPYTEGNGNLTLVQVDGNFATNSGDLVNTVQSTPAWGDLGGYTIAYTREEGRSLITTLKLSTWEELGVGFNAAAAPGDLTSIEHSIYAQTTDGQFSTETIGNIFDGLSLNTDYSIIIMLRAAGAWLLLDDGNTWQLIDVNDTGASTPLYHVYSILDGIGRMDTLRTDVIAANLRPSTGPLSDSYSLIPTIADSGSNGLNGTPVGVGLGGSAAFFNSSDSYIQLDASDIEAAGFDTARFGIAVRAQVSSADIWTDGVGRGIFNLGADASNFLDLRRSGGANALRARYVAGGTTSQVSITASPTDFFGLGMTVDIDAGASGEVKAFLDGAQTGSTLTALGTFVNSLVDSLCVVGALSNTPANIWQGGVKEAILTLNGVVPNETQWNFITNTSNAITDAYLNTQFGVGNWARLPLNEQYSSDGLGHIEADGSGAGKSRNGATWSHAGSKRRNGAVGGADLLTNGNFSAWTADDPDGWTVSGESGSDPEVSEVGTGEGHGGVGTGMANMFSSATNFQPRLQQAILTIGKWYRVQTIIDTATSGRLVVHDAANGLGNVFYTTSGTKVFVGRALSTVFDMQGSTVLPTDMTVDSVSVQEIPIADLLDLVETNTPDVVARVNLFTTDDTPGGIAVAWDSVSNPQNGLVVYVDRALAKIRVEKWLAGAFSSTLVDQAVTFGAGDIMEVHLSDSDADGTYILRTYYNRGNKSETTFSDAGIIGNTIHGLFGLTDGGFAEKENVWQKDYVTQFDQFYS